MRAEFRRPDFDDPPRVNTPTGDVTFGPIQTQALPTGTVIHIRDAADMPSETLLRLPLFGDAPRVIPRTPFLTPSRLELLPDLDQYSNDAEVSNHEQLRGDELIS